MMKNKTLERLMRFLITLMGAGVSAGIGALLIPIWMGTHPEVSENPFMPVLVYTGVGIVGALVFYLLSQRMITYTLHLMTKLETIWDGMSTQQVIFMSIGLIVGLMVAALFTQLILSAGASLITISLSALVYVVLGSVGLSMGYRRSNSEKQLFAKFRHRGQEKVEDVSSDVVAKESHQSPKKFLDTSVIIDGRIVDIVKTGFLEGDIVVTQFVLAELRHIADSGDSLRRVRGRRGLDVLAKLQKELKTPILIEDKDYSDTEEVDVKLLRLCREQGATVVTNDYNLNKVAGVTGINVLNINDLANAVKPMLMAGEELNVLVVREGKEPGQGVAYLDDGTMIVVDNARRHVGQTVTVLVTSVLQTSAGRMIFTKMKDAIEEKAC